MQAASRTRARKVNKSLHSISPYARANFRFYQVFALFLGSKGLSFLWPLISPVLAETKGKILSFLFCSPARQCGMFGVFLFVRSPFLFPPAFNAARNVGSKQAISY